MTDVDGVETQDDFAASLEEAGIVELLLGDVSAPDGETPVDTGSAVGQPRDEKGRFTSTAEDGQQEGTLEGVDSPDPSATAVPEVPVEDDSDIVLEIDDDLQGIIDRFDGDIGKALRALGDSQSMIGRQANEVGQLRQQLAELQEQMQQGFQSFQQQPRFFGPYQNDLEENPKGLLAEALERGDADTMHLAIRAWGEEEPFEAAAFLFSLNQQQASPAQSEPVAAQQAVGESLEQAMADVVARHPDVEKYLPAIGETAKEFPTLRNFMEQGTPAQKAQAFEELVVIAKTRSQQTDTSAAMKRVILKTQEEVRKERADAAVVSAQNQSAATAEESNIDVFYRVFDEAAERYAPADWITRSND